MAKRHKNPSVFTIAIYKHFFYLTLLISLINKLATASSRYKHYYHRSLFLIILLKFCFTIKYCKKKLFNFFSTNN